MRIGIDARFINRESTTGGLGRYSFELVKNLLRIDRQNQYVILVKDQRDLPAFLRKPPKNAQIISTGIAHYSLAEQTKLPKIIKETGCDLVHFTHFNHPIFYKGKFIVTIHDLTLSRFPARRDNPLKKAAYHLVMKHAIDNSEAIIAVSKWTKKDVIRTYGLSPQKIKVIYEGIDAKQFQKPTRKTIAQTLKKYRLSAPYIVSVGQWRSHKNLAALVEAFAKLKNKHPNLKLVFVGKIDPFNPLLKKVRELNLQKDIIYTGFVSSKGLSAIYAAAKAFVFPSLAEGFGLPGLEAMAAGTPVVASNSSCLPEIFEEAAVYFNPYNISAMAKSIRTVIADPHLSRKLIQKGKNQIKKYSWEKMARETLRVYEKMSNAK